jgi:hypothetical protein
MEKRNDRIGVPDPESEPRPPKVTTAGDLGPTGEEKERDEKERIWKERPPTRDQKR